MTFEQLAKENISSQQLYFWSAPIDLIENYQFYLNQISTNDDSFLANRIFYNCTWPRFGPKCQYELYTHLPDHSSTYDIIHNFYQTLEYNPIHLTCYKHLQCNHRLSFACLDWSEICDGKIDCLDDGIDEEHCWQLEINDCKYDEYRCNNGQCISQSFYMDDTFNPECLDKSDKELPIDFALQQCRRSEPSFRCEDVICKGVTSYESRFCIFPRRNLLLELISLNKANSTSEECWAASTCLLRSSYSASKFCENFCAKNACINIIAQSCPDILYIPDSIVPFGHLYLTYKKIIKENSTTQNIWLLYICYTMSYYDAFFQMVPKIILSNRTCFFYETLAWLDNGLDTYVTNRTNLQDLGKKFQKYHLIYNYNSTMCNRSSMYQCINSPKCVSVYRLLDKTEDCPYMDDENMTAIYNSHIMKELKNTHFKCQTTNKYIHRSFVNDRNCDCKPNEYYECDDEDVNGFNPYTNISFQTICDGFTELLPKRINEQNHTDETECQQWSCDNIYTRCDGIWHCLSGADEINCNLFPSLKCPNNHHRCLSPHTNKFMCLPIEKMNDGKVDCLGGSDEIKLCRPEYASMHSQIFYCKRENMIPCLPSRLLCNGKKDCDDGDDEQFCKTNRTLTTGAGICTSSSSTLQSDVEKFLCNQTASYIKERTIGFKLDGMSNSIVYQMKNTENTMLSSSSNIQISSNQYQSYCQRGLHLHVWLNNRSTDHACLCPPSYYGSRCQYQNQRISLTIKFRAFSDSYQTLFAIIISLIDDGDDRIIHSYEQITYLSFSHCETKFNIYLLYATRPKNLTKQYRTHIDFYEKISLAYRGSVLLPVTFPFLPIQRLTFIVNIPRVDNKTSNSVKYRCVHGKSIQYSNNPDIPNFCQCDQGWSGRYCTIKYNCNCANDSVCLGISASNRSICICPIHKFGPRCFLTNTICQNNPICQNGGQCIPNDEYFASEKQFICLCRKGFTGDLCEINETKLILSFHKNIALSQSIFIHFIQITDQQFPVRSTTFRTISFPQDSLTIYWLRPFHLVFIELENKNYYLTIKQTIYSESTIINERIDPSDHCPHIREVLNETIVQWDLIRRIKYYHLPCQHQSLNLSCFYDEVHLCLCYDFQQQRLANCFNFTHNMTFDCAGQSVCKNNGKCFQDVLECPTRSICMCEPCFYGLQCQFSTSGFELSLDAILGYHILPNGTLNDQPVIIKISFALTIICMVIGLLDSIFSVMTFKNKVVREVGCGLYLLCSSITTLLIMIIFGLKFFILLFAQMTILSNRLFLLFQCHSMDFLLRIGLYMDQWLNACVAAERACTVIKGASFSKKKSKRTAIFVIILLVIIISGTCIHDPISRDLIDEESNNDNVKRTWCIVNYGSALRAYNSVINTIHFFGPFLINLISSIILIRKKSRQEATIHRKRPYKQILIEQFQRNKHLLTAPIVSVILTLPRLIITFVSKCLKSNDDAWLFLLGYFISFIPSMITFIVFILPSKFYQKEFRKSCTRIQMMIQRRSHLTS